MKTAVFAVLVAAGVGLSAEEIAFNYNVDTSAVDKRLRQLKSKGHVFEDDGIYYPDQRSEAMVVMRSAAARKAD